MSYGKPKKVPRPVSDFPEFNKDNPPEPGDDFASGAIFLTDKPKGWSSFRVVGLLRKLTGIKRTGHAGTLDPMATGLLIVCTGKATKSISLIQDERKTYIAEIQLGAATESYDAETGFTATSDFSHVSLDNIRSVFEESFQGNIEQFPPMYSALQHKGERLYRLARQGIEVERKAREVCIYDTEILNFDQQAGKISASITCSKGTYIRTIAHDLGQKLGTHGYLTALRRTASGAYSVERALTAEQLITNFNMHGKIDLS